MRTVLLILTLTFSIQTFAQDNSDNCNCCKEPFRQFDFWVGDWEVKDSSGTLLGNNRIHPIEKGCGLEENWTGAKGTTGTSISFYNQYTKQWHQSWVDINGGVIVMDGDFKDGSMVLLTPKRENEDGYFQNRTSWTPLEDGRVRHLWEQTKDGGKTWIIVFEGFYSKK